MSGKNPIDQLLRFGGAEAKPAYRHVADKIYSITSSARASRVGGTAMPSVFAVFKLIANSNFVGCMTGRSAGFSPFSIRPV